ncbi:MAG: hypothetical protein ACRD0G_13170 [Acidimicrobiales bacterium]
MRRAVTLGVLGVAAVAATMLNPVAPSDAADGEFVFSGVAVAAPFEFEVASSSLPLSPSVGGSSPAAQALLDSLGQSRGYAAAPYPGETVTALPGLLATLGMPYLPPYPLIAQTEAPTATEDSVTQGPLRLTATSGADASSSEAAVDSGAGLATMSATATVRRDAASGTIEAVSASAFDGLHVTDALHLGTVVSRASASRAPGGDAYLEQSTTVDALVIGGLRVGLRPDGLHLLGLDLPLPANLNQVLGGLGITITYLAPQVEPDGNGIVASGVEITQVINDALPTPLTVRVTLGRARARLSSTPVPAVNLGGFPAPAATPTAAAPVVAPSRSQPAAAAPNVPAPAASPTAPPTAAPAAENIRVDLVQFALGSFYLILVLAAAVTLGAGRLFHYVGVREPWHG